MTRCWALTPGVPPSALTLGREKCSLPPSPHFLIILIWEWNAPLSSHFCDLLERTDFASLILFSFFCVCFSLLLMQPSLLNAGQQQQWYKIVVVFPISVCRVARKPPWTLLNFMFLLIRGVFGILCICEKYSKSRWFLWKLGATDRLFQVLFGTYLAYFLTISKEQLNIVDDFLSFRKC